MYDFHTKHNRSDENILRKSTIKVHKKLKINLIKITESSVERMIKEHKKIDCRKEKKIRFFHPEKNPVYFLCSTEKKLTCDQKSEKSDITQVTA